MIFVFELLMYLLVPFPIVGDNTNKGRGIGISGY
jgi:hypothetical protein